MRGFALLGISLVNILYWSGWVLMTPAQQVAHAGADARHVQWYLDHLLLDGKFYTLFSLMFGVGLGWIGQLSLPAIYGRRIAFRDAGAGVALVAGAACAGPH